MKKGRFSEEQIIGILKQAESGRGMPELSREHGVTETTLYLSFVVIAYGSGFAEILCSSELRLSSAECRSGCN
jgi:hypothetical protein